MKAWEEFAFISNNKIQNVACFAIGGYSLANSIAKEQYGADAIAVEVTQYPVQAGDDYIEGHFYRDGSEILAYLTDEQQIAVLVYNNEELSASVDELILAITPTEAN